MRTALTSGRSRLAQSASNLASSVVAAGLGERREVGEQGGDVLDVEHREANGDAGVERAVDHRAANVADRGAEALSGAAGVQVVGRDSRPGLGEQLADLLRRPVEGVGGAGVGDRLDQPRPTREQLARGDGELAVAAVLGGVELRRLRRFLQRSSPTYASHEYLAVVVSVCEHTFDS